MTVGEFINYLAQFDQDKELIFKYRCASFGDNYDTHFSAGLS